jgi:hypothetical protein
MALTVLRRAPQCRFHPPADATPFSPSLLPNLANQGHGQLHRKNTLDLRDRYRAASILGLLKITVRLAPRNAVTSTEEIQNLWCRGFLFE